MCVPHLQHTRSTASWYWSLQFSLFHSQLFVIYKRRSGDLNYCRIHEYAPWTFGDYSLFILTDVLSCHSLKGYVIFFTRGCLGGTSAVAWGNTAASPTLVWGDIIHSHIQYVCASLWTGSGWLVALFAEDAVEEEEQGWRERAEICLLCRTVRWINSISILTVKKVLFFKAQNSEDSLHQWYNLHYLFVMYQTYLQKYTAQHYERKVAQALPEGCVVSKLDQ